MLHVVETFKSIRKSLKDWISWLFCKFKVGANVYESIFISQSFGRAVTTTLELEEALTTYVAKACVKMRGQNTKVQGIAAFLITNRYNKDIPFYKNGKSFYFDLAMDTTLHILNRKYSPKCVQARRNGLTNKQSTFKTLISI